MTNSEITTVLQNWILPNLKLTTAELDLQGAKFAGEQIFYVNFICSASSPVTETLLSMSCNKHSILLIVLQPLGSLFFSPKLKFCFGLLEKERLKFQFNITSTHHRYEDVNVYPSYINHHPLEQIPDKQNIFSQVYTQAHITLERLTGFANLKLETMLKSKTSQMDFGCTKFIGITWTHNTPDAWYEWKI